MCIGCGARAPQSELLRVWQPPGGDLALAAYGRTGRSGYLHRREECWAKFAARKGPVRSLGRTVDRGVRGTFVEGLRRVGPPAMKR
jgi:predicted RNA-binding protein YlxR (DUF448 family)